MKNVTVSRKELLAKVIKNRDAHREIFLKAQVGYRAAVVTELDKMLEEARQNKPIRRQISLIEPSDNTEDYNRVIAMLEMSTEEKIELQSHEFDQYVLDNWQWKAMAMFANNSYLGGEK